MAKLCLDVVTPEGNMYSGEVDRIKVRTTNGDVCILPRHIDYAATLGHGEVKIVAKDGVRLGEAQGGMIYVTGETVQLLTSDFKWKE